MVEKVDTWDGIDFAKFGMFLYDKIRVLYGVISSSQWIFHAPKRVDQKNNFILQRRQR